MFRDIEPPVAEAIMQDGEAASPKRRRYMVHIVPGKEEEFRYLRGWLAASDRLDRLIAATEHAGGPEPVSAPAPALSTAAQPATTDADAARPRQLPSQTTVARRQRVVGHLARRVGQTLQRIGEGLESWGSAPPQPGKRTPPILLACRAGASHAARGEKRRFQMHMRKSWIVLIAALALTLGLAACDIDDGDGETVRGSGNVVTEDMALADFTSVEAHSSFVVEITQSDTFAVTTRVDDNIVDLLDVSKKGDTLRLRLKRAVSLRGDVTLEADITMPDLDGLNLSGASSASVSGFRSSGSLDIDLSGASRVDGDLQGGNVDIEASGASRVVLEGSATGLTIDGSGASRLDLADFTVNTAEVRLSGASEATLRVVEQIAPVEVSGASRLRYLGDPTLSDVSTSGGSTVDKVGD